jgi:hypothetical protein
MSLNSCFLPKHYWIDDITIKNAKMVKGEVHLEYELEIHSVFSDLDRKIITEKDKIIIQFARNSDAKPLSERDYIWEDKMVIPNKNGLPVFVSNGKSRKLAWAKKVRE